MRRHIKTIFSVALAVFIYSVSITGFGQEKREGDSCDDCKGVMETLDFFWIAKNEMYVTSNLHRFFVVLDKAFNLHLDIRIQPGVLLTISAENGKSLRITETPLYSSKIEPVCIFVKSLIERQLSEVDFHYCLDEYVSDLVLTANDNDAWLMSESAIPLINVALSDVQFRKDETCTFSVIAKKSKPFPNHTLFRLGDRLLKVNGVPTNYLGGGALLKLISISKGDSIPVEFERNGITMNSYLKKANEQIISNANSEDFSFKVIDEILLCKIKTLKKGFAKTFENECSQIVGLKGIILDLTECYEGFLDEAVLLSSLFLEKGDTVSRIKYVNKQSSFPKLFVSKRDKIIKQRTIILTSVNTASGAEVVVSALKSSKSTLVIGSKTFGDGEVKNAYRLRSKNYYLGIKLGELLTPTGEIISGMGFEPDIKADGDLIELAFQELRK